MNNPFDPNIRRYTFWDHLAEQEARKSPEQRALETMAIQDRHVFHQPMPVTVSSQVRRITTNNQGDKKLDDWKYRITKKTVKTDQGEQEVVLEKKRKPDQHTGVNLRPR